LNIDSKEIYYDCVAIVCHIGESMTSGHYVAYTIENDQWMLYNDLTRQTVDMSEVQAKASQNSYLLIYQKTRNSKKRYRISDIENQRATDNSIIIAPSAPLEEEEVICELNDSFKHHVSITEIKDEMNDESDDDSDTGYEDSAEDNRANYVDVDGVKMFFNKKIGEISVSGLLSINNLLEKRIVRDHEVDDAILLWSEFGDIRNLLQTQGYKIEEIYVENFDFLKKENEIINPLLVKNNQHYFVIKCIEKKLFILDPNKGCPQKLNEKHISYLNAVKNNSQTLSLFKVSQSNSSITINKIYMDNPIDNNLYGKVLQK
jgi:hypothetical protein